MKIRLDSLFQVISCGLILNNTQKTIEENFWLYGDDYSPKGMGLNLELRLFYNASVQQDPSRVEKVKGVLREFDHKVLNESHQKLVLPTLENLFLVLQEKINATNFVWERLEISHGKGQQNKEQKVMGESQSDKIFYTKKYCFSSLHRHNNPELTEEENRKLFGKCSGIHGHQYEFEVFCKGKVNSNSGLVVARRKLDIELYEKTLLPLKGRYLNEIMGNTSGELILQKISQKFLAQNAFPEIEMHFRLNETRKNSFFSSTTMLF